MGVPVHYFTDPGCPFAFSAERQRLQLHWHYDTQLQIETRMIVLARSGREYVDTGSSSGSGRCTPA